jgi:hypothetical protein
VNELKQKLKKINWFKAAQILFAAVLILAPAGMALALDDPGCPPGLNCDAPGDLNELILKIINYILGVTLAIDVLFLIIGGFFYITSAGNESRASKGKTTVINAVIGLVVIVLSYVIANVVANFFVNN